jgi:hypothetical protein
MAAPIGLQMAGVPASELRHDVEQLISAQRADGGWAQTAFLDSDAFRGAAYLLQSQYLDGSWHLRSRAPKFQPYFQSGFPFDHDQWISSTATSWVLIALSHATKTPPMTVAQLDARK